jgi:hypothetical protein
MARNQQQRHSDADRPIYFELAGSGAPLQSFAIDETMSMHEVIVEITANGSFKFLLGLGRAAADAC